METNAKKITVAYAEDHIVVRDAMVEYLEKGAEIEVVHQCNNGKELLEALILANDLPDVCIIDINMPVMNGFTLLKEIRKRWPQLPCLVLTSFIEDAYVINMVKSGVNGYLTKSCTGNELVGAVKSIYANGHFFNDILNEKIIQDIIIESKKSPVLNDREIQLLQFVCSDLSYADIAKKWETTYRTVDGIRERLYLKLHITSRIGLVLAAIRLGYYTIDSEKFSQP